jgi:Nuclease-related domain
MASSRIMKLRYPGRCARCSASVDRGERAHYDAVTRKVRCLACHRATETTPPTAALTGSSSGNAGTSAQREYEHRRDAREQRFRRALPLIGPAVAKLTEPHHQIAWARGAAGERQGAAALAKHTARDHVIYLHDRLRPGTRTNIDHIAIGPGGITVIDSKRLHGQIRIEHSGLLRPRAQLRVGGRDRTKLVDAVLTQVDTVQSALSAIDLGHADVRGALQFIEGDLPLIGLQKIRGVAVGSPRKIAKLAKRSGPWSPTQIGNVAALLNAALPPA